MDTTKLNRHNPTHFHLVRGWMLTNFSGMQAIVFFKPNEHIENISKRFDIPHIQLINSDIYIHVTDDSKAIKTVNNLSEEDFGYVMLWGGQNFVTENT